MQLETSKVNRDCWCANGGAGNALNILRSGTLRKALLTVLTAGAMVLGTGHAAQAQVEPPAATQCPIDDGMTVTCTGNLSAGVLINNSANSSSYTTLNVNDLTIDIEPEDGVAGISFTSDGDITIISDTGAFGITTTDKDSHGIRVNSPGAVTVTQTGDITTSGISSYGVYALSGSGDIMATQTGTITTTGGNSYGIYAYSNGNISITLNGGTITSDLSEGVEFDGSASNTLTLNNTVTISGGTYDILGGSGGETINNQGTLTTLGSINLGAGANVFNNMVGAVFNSGEEVILGAGNVFTNSGDLSPGGADGVQTTVLTGDFQQKDTGTFTVTLDGDISDQLNVTGTAILNVTGTAILNGGTVSVTGTPVFDHTYTILTAGAEDGVTGTFDSLTGSTLFVKYALNYDDPNKVDLEASRIQDFCDVAGTSNQQAVACDGLDRLSTTHDVVQAVLASTTQEEARAAYDHLSPEVFQIQQNILISNLHFV